MTVSERFMVEEFDTSYPNKCKLKVALKNYPEFDNLKPVKEFTNEDKIKYIRVIRYVDQMTQYNKAAKAGLIPALDVFDEDFTVPEYISKTYLSTIL